MRELKKRPKLKFARVLVKRFDKFHHLCTLHIFAFCFALPQIRFKQAEV